MRWESIVRGSQIVTLYKGKVGTRDLYRTYPIGIPMFDVWKVRYCTLGFAKKKKCVDRPINLQIHQLIDQFHKEKTIHKVNKIKHMTGWRFNQYNLIWFQKHRLKSTWYEIQTVFKISIFKWQHTEETNKKEQVDNSLNSFCWDLFIIEHKNTTLLKWKSKQTRWLGT